MRQIFEFLVVWTVVGYFLVALGPVPHRKWAAHWIFVGGPFAWFVFLVCAIEHWSYRQPRRRA